MLQKTPTPASKVTVIKRPATKGFILPRGLFWPGDWAGAGSLFASLWVSMVVLVAANKGSDWLVTELGGLATVFGNVAGAGSRVGSS